MLFNLSSKINAAIYSQNVKKQQCYFIAKPVEAVCWLPTDSVWPQLLLATQILLL